MKLCPARLTIPMNRMNPFSRPILAGIAVAAVCLGGSAHAEVGNYDRHGLKRLVDRVIYKQDGEYKGSIPKMQSSKESGFKTASICKIASTTLKAFYKRDLNQVAEYYSDLFGDIYVMALDPELTVAEGSLTLFEEGHSERTSQWAAQRMSIIRSVMTLLHGDLELDGPEGMPAFERNPKNAALTTEEFTQFMVELKKKAGSSKSLTTVMAAALASSPSQLNGLVERSSFLIKDKISGLLADPAGGDSEVPMEMRTSPNVFNPRNVGDLYLALGLFALHFQNADALSEAGIVPPKNMATALDDAKEKFIDDDRASKAKLAEGKQGIAKWNAAPLGPAKL